MKNFHVTDSASHAYQFVWDNRKTIARTAAIPFAVKIGCLVLILLIGASDNYLRQGLLLLPAHFTEGWFVATMVMMCMHKIPNQPSLLPRGTLSRTQRLQGSIALYVLIQILFAFLMHIVNDATPIADKTQGAPVSPVEFFGLIAALAFAIWAFRFTLLHIPIAMGYGLKRYARTFKSYNVSLRMICLTMLCTIPAALTMIITLNVLGNIIDFEHLNKTLTGLILGSVQALLQMPVLAISSVAMVYAFYPHLSGKSLKT